MIECKYLAVLAAALHLASLFNLETEFPAAVLGLAVTLLSLRK